MTPNLIALYSCAALTIMVLCLFARQNRKSGWKRNRTENLAEALQDFYVNLGVAVEEQAAVPELKTVTAEEALGFSTQMMKLRSALGSTVSQGSPVRERELVHQ